MCVMSDTSMHLPQLTKGSKLFPFKVDTFSEGTKNNKLEIAAYPDSVSVE